jgi:hypothetical protein
VVVKPIFLIKKIRRGGFCVLEVLSSILSYMDSFRSVVANGVVKHYLFMVCLSDSSLLSDAEGLWPFCSVEYRGGGLYAEYMVRPPDLGEFLNRVRGSGLFRRREAYRLTLNFNGFPADSVCRGMMMTFNVSSRGILDELVSCYSALGDRVVEGSDGVEVYVDTSVSGLAPALLERVSCLSF